MFAFMKNTNVYYSDDRGIISNYSEHYFGALSFLLKEKLDEKSFEKLSVLRNNEEFKSLLFSDRQIDKEFIENIAQDIKDSEIKEIFLQISSPNSIRKTLSLLLEKRAELYYLIGLVYYFRLKDSNKKDNFKIDIKSLIPYEVAEISLAILGIYLGYGNIRAVESVELKNKNFKKIFGTKFNMKFQMDSKLDYITIEALYNYSFYNKKKGDEFGYLQYPKPPKPMKIRNSTTLEISSKIKMFEKEYITLKAIAKIKPIQGKFDV